MKNGKVLITGASRGLGLAIAKRLLTEGYGVVAMNRSNPPELAALSDQYPDSLELWQCDLLNVEDVSEDISRRLHSDEVQLSAFINNAAVAYDDLVTNLQVAPLEEMFRINVFSPMVITRGAIRNFILHGTQGSIVHISSISVHTGYKGLAMYASTKGALEAFSKNTAREWGERKIRSNCIVCGFMETEMSAGLDDVQKERIYRRTSLKQPTSLESVAAMARLLVSEDGHSITGQNLHVDSGTV